jgi:PHD/YefM family antitoxin component YafN of YafNO toxin-antitoxin module
MAVVVPVYQARRRLGELIEQAFYQGRPFILTRGKKPMAALIGTETFSRILELLERYDPGLADTLAIMTNPEIQAILEEGEQDIRAGRVLPFDESLLED